MEVIESHKTQLSEQILDYQSKLMLKQTEIEELQKRLKYITTEYQETKQQVCTYIYIHMCCISSGVTRPPS